MRRDTPETLDLAKRLGVTGVRLEKLSQVFKPPKDVDPFDFYSEVVNLSGRGTKHEYTALRLAYRGYITERYLNLMTDLVNYLETNLTSSDPGKLAYAVQRYLDDNPRSTVPGAVLLNRIRRVAVKQERSSEPEETSFALLDACDDSLTDESFAVNMDEVGISQLERLADVQASDNDKRLELEAMLSSFKFHPDSILEVVRTVSDAELVHTARLAKWLIEAAAVRLLRLNVLHDDDLEMLGALAAPLLVALRRNGSNLFDGIVQ